MMSGKKYYENDLLENLGRIIYMQQLQRDKMNKNNVIIYVITMIMIMNYAGSQLLKVSMIFRTTLILCSYSHIGIRLAWKQSVSKDFRRGSALPVCIFSHNSCLMLRGSISA